MGKTVRRGKRTRCKRLSGTTKALKLAQADARAKLQQPGGLTWSGLPLDPPALGEPEPGR